MRLIYENILLFLSGLVIDSFYVYFCYKLLNKKINWKSIKIWIIIFIMTIIGMILNNDIPRAYKIIISLLFLFSVVYIITDKKIKDTILIFVSLQIDLIISEAISFALLYRFITDDKSYIVTVISNILVSAIGYMIMKSKMIIKTFNKTNKVKNLLDNKEFLMCLIAIIIILVSTTIESYMKLPIIVVLITNMIISLIFILIMIKFVIVKSRYNMINSKFQTSITSLKEYETMIDKYRVNNHENKNELITIRNMIINNKRAVKYIDELINNKIKDNEKIMTQATKIPEGGLRAVMYSKMCLMKEKNIDYNINIARNIKTTDLINVNDTVMVSICRILGVLLDNAIEAVEKLDKKIIQIELYVLDNKLCIDITNNYSGTIDLSKMSKQKYTTKGKGHGYGLKLVEQIVEDNKDKIENTKSITGDLFTQSIKTKM